MKLWVQSIVSARDNKPYVMLQKDENTIAQLSMSEARGFANDILLAASRGEADAMILHFFRKAEFPDGAAGALLVEFRDFRADLDERKDDGGTLYEGPVEGTKP